jgi:transcriptional regulator with XRE-family HTH domain
MDIPSDFGIPTCVNCGEEMMSAQISSRLDAILQEQYLKRQATQLRTSIQLLKLRHSVTQQEIEDACGVTRSYLSHLMSGKREAGATLMRLIEIFTLFGDTFEHAREGACFNFEESVARVFELRTVGQKKYQARSAGPVTKYRHATRFVEHVGLPSLAS